MKYKVWIMAGMVCVENKFIRSEIGVGLDANDE